MSKLFPTYNRWDVAIESGQGATVKDNNGKEYLDFVSGIGVTSLGHCHPKVQAAVQQQLGKVWHVSNLFQIEQQEEVAAKLVEHSSGDVVMFCNSGAEANEAAIKLARKHSGNHKIITFERSFHGRTLGTLAATGQDKVKKGFGPQLASFVHIPYNDIEALQNALDDETAAVMVEAVQGEGGVRPANQEFLQQVEKACRDHNSLLILDEVQTGIGRTGKAFAYQHSGISPDIITTAKGLGNGFPVGAMIGKQELADTFGPGSHGTTFGGNQLAMTAANAVLDVVFDESFLKDVIEKGEYLLAQLDREIGGFSFVEEVRGQGLMIGIACHEEVGSMVTKLRNQGLLVLVAGPKVIRLLPPLIVTYEQIRSAVALLTKELHKQEQALFASK
ncbi:MAG TPA: acetylornithine transaminase [Bacillales bacterium]|nr:acetylornithine transaminase [Bacillales bacterium]